MRLLVTLAALLGLAAPAGAAFTEILPPPGTDFGASQHDRLRVVAVNRHSQVLLNTRLYNRDNVVSVWAGGAHTIVRPLPGLSQPQAIGHNLNDAGNVVGASSVPGVHSNGNRAAAVLWTAPGAAPQDLGDLTTPATDEQSFTQSAATWVDGAGVPWGTVATDSPDPQGRQAAASWPGGGTAAIVGDGRGLVAATTAAGVKLIDVMGGPSGGFHLLSPEGAYTKLTCPSGSFLAEHVGEGSPMGEQGVVAGSMYDGSAYVPATYFAGTCAPLPLPAGVTNAKAVAINDAGAIVGHGSRGAMLWPGDGSVEFLDETRNPGDGWRLSKVVDIGNDGEIVGYGRKGGETDDLRVWLLDAADNALAATLAAGTIGANDLFELKLTLRNTAAPAIKDVAVAGAPIGLLRDDTVFGAPVLGLAPLFGPAPGLPAELPGDAAIEHLYAFAVDAPGSTQLQTRVTGTDTAGAPHSDTAAVRVEAAYRDPGAQDFDALIASGILSVVEAHQQAGRAALKRFADGVKKKLAGKGNRKLRRLALYDLTLAQTRGLPDDALSWVPRKGRAATAIQFARGIELGLEQTARKAFDENVALPFKFWADLWNGTPEYRASVSAQVAAISREDEKIVGEYLGTARDLWTSPEKRADAWTQLPKIAAEARVAAKQLDIALSNKVIEWDDAFKKHPEKTARAYGTEVGKVMGMVAVTTAEDLVEGKAKGAFVKLFRAADKASPVKNAISDVSTAPGRLAGAGAKPLAQTPSLGNLSPAQIERVQQIAKTVGDKVGAKLEIQARPINEYAAKVKGGIGKIEVVPTKNLTPDDVLLGAPAEYLAQTAYYQPKLPKGFAKLPPGEQARLKLRQAEKQLEYDQFTGAKPDPTGKAAKVAKALKPGGGEFTLGKNGKAVMELEKTTHKSGAVLIRYKRLEVNGKAVFTGKPRPIVSDVDFNAVIDATTGRALPAGIRGQAELLTMREFEKAAQDGVFPFGFHGWTHSGFDIGAADFRHILKYQLMYMQPDAARKLAEKFAPLYNTTADAFLAGYTTGRFLVRVTESTATLGTGS